MGKYDGIIGGMDKYGDPCFEICETCMYSKSCVDLFKEEKNKSGSCRNYAPKNR